MFFIHLFRMSSWDGRVLASDKPEICKTDRGFISRQVVFYQHQVNACTKSSDASGPVIDIFFFVIGPSQHRHMTVC